jgi:adenylate kinase
LLMGRLTGRRVCKGCGATFHVEFKPPKAEGRCDDCSGGKLYQRDDDKEEVISSRLDVYEKNTVPVIEYYKNKGKYVEIDGTGEAKEVFDRLNKAIH